MKTNKDKIERWKDLSKRIGNTKKEKIQYLFSNEEFDELGDYLDENDDWTYEKLLHIINKYGERVYKQAQQSKVDEVVDYIKEKKESVLVTRLDGLDWDRIFTNARTLK